MTTIQAGNIVTKETKTDWTGRRGTKCILIFFQVFLESSYMKEEWKKDVGVWNYDGSKLCELLEEIRQLGIL
jgi:hypothetical protein